MEAKNSEKFAYGKIPAFKHDYGAILFQANSIL
jgi:hypothetical protein